MSKSEPLQKIDGIPVSILPGPCWKIEDGVSYSLLSRFIQCRDRFHKYAIYGMRESSDRQRSLNFGTYFHKLLEISAKDQRCNSNKVIEKVTRSKSSIKKITHIDRLMGNMIFHEYMKHYGDQTDHYLDTETKFDVRYPLPGIGSIRFVGKMDQTIILPDKSLMIQENKTSENINEAKLDATIPFQLQTMFYSIAAEQHFKRKVKGVLYNVIRKPKHRQKQGESDVEFVERVRQEIVKAPGYFFYRWRYAFQESSIPHFKQFTLDPLLRDFYLWWKSIERNPLNPWVDEKGQPNSRHYRRPFGVYDSLTNGVGDYFNVLTRKSLANVTLGNNPFSELEEDEQEPSN